MVKGFSDSKPGDLVFFQDKEGKDIHVGILLDDDKIIHAHGRVRVDHFMEEGILNSETKIFTHSFQLLRRVL